MAKQNESDPGAAPRAGETDEQQQDRQALAARLSQIDHKFLVLSGKGGVGKSTVAANLAVALARHGPRVGLLDIDFHGPSIPKLLGLEGRPVPSDGKTLYPVQFENGLKVVSMGFLLRSSSDAVIWRGPLKMHAIRQFLRDVEWGELDYLIVDSPPGTGDEPLSIVQLIAEPEGQPGQPPTPSPTTRAIVVTTPQDVAVADVRRCIGFCGQLNLSVAGVIENMSGFVCPHCGERTDVFGSGGGEHMAKEMGVPFLGRVPVDPQIVAGGDQGKPFAVTEGDDETARAFAAIVERLAEETDENAPSADK
jgi:Mrp family chromosome partitioning ATPase